MALNRIDWSLKGPAARALVPELVKLLGSDDTRPSGIFVDATTHVAVPHGRYVRAVAADLLASIGPDAAEAVPTLTEALHDERLKKDGHCYLAARALGRIGPSAKAAVPALHSMLKEEDVYAALWAAEALWKIDATERENVTPVLEGAFKLRDPPIRVKAARVHWKINAQPAVVLPVLIELLQDNENHWMVDTIRAIEDLGPEAKAALPALQQKLKDNDEVVRRVTAEVLKQIDFTASTSLKP